jgi:anti-sigma B factor antagonist
MTAVASGRERRMHTHITIAEIDPSSADAFRAEVAAAMTHAADHGGEVVLDFADVTFIDSTGLTVLIDAHRTLGAEDRTLTIVNVSAHVERVFAVTGLEQFLPPG